MRSLPLVLVLFSLSACGEGSTKVEGDNTGGTEEPGGTGDEDTDNDDGGDEEEEDTTSIDDFVSDWTGEVSIWSEEDAWGWDDCSGTLTLDVDPDGEVEGDGLCEGEDDGGWGGPDSYEMDFVGEINDDGELVGTLTVAADGWGDVVMELEATADLDADRIDGEAAGSTTVSGWGDSEYTLALEAELSLERE